MGHYRSEMGYEERDKEQAQREAQILKDTTAKIERMIKNEGIASVLAEIVIAGKIHSLIQY